MSPTKHQCPGNLCSGQSGYSCIRKPLTSDDTSWERQERETIWQSVNRQAEQAVKTGRLSACLPDRPTHLPYSCTLYTRKTLASQPNRSKSSPLGRGTDGTMARQCARCGLLEGRWKRGLSRTHQGQKNAFSQLFVVFLLLVPESFQFHLLANVMENKKVIGYNS